MTLETWLGALSVAELPARRPRRYELEELLRNAI